MENYICVEKVEAELATNHDFATWANDDVLPSEYASKPVINGYKVKESNGAVYWLSDTDFEAKFSRTGELTLGEAVAVMSAGGKVTRTGWSNPAIWCEIQVPDEDSKMTEPYIYMVKDAKKFPLDLSCENLLATDWTEVE